MDKWHSFYGWMPFLSPNQEISSTSLFFFEEEEAMSAVDNDTYFTVTCESLCCQPRLFPLPLLTSIKCEVHVAKSDFDAFLATKRTYS